MLRKVLVLFLGFSSTLNVLKASSIGRVLKKKIIDSPAGVDERIVFSGPNPITYCCDSPSEIDSYSPLMKLSSEEITGDCNDHEISSLPFISLFDISNKNLRKEEDGFPRRSVSFAIEDEDYDDVSAYEIKSEYSLAEATFESDRQSTGKQESSSELFHEFQNRKPTAEEIRIIDEFLTEEDKLRYPMTVNHYLPAYKAALKSDMKTLKKIVGYNINLDAFDIRTGETPLHAAIRRGNTEIIKFILSKVKNWNPINRSGRTPFAVAASSGEYELVLWMITNRDMFDTTTPDNDGRTPLMLAALNRKTKIFNLLRGIGSDVLHRDDSGRSLLTLLPRTDRIHELIMAHLKNQSKNNKEQTIRRLAPEFGMIYRNQQLGGHKLVMSILSELDISLFEFVSAPQAHDSNLLMAILDAKKYKLYNSLTTSHFDINDTVKSAEFDQISFFNRCLQVATKETIDFLCANKSPLIDINSFEAIFAVDSVKVLKAIESHRDFDLYVEGVNILVPAGLAKANKCFRYLGLKFSKINYPDMQATNFFCEAAIEISKAAAANPDIIKNLFETFPNAMASCSESELSYVDDLDADV